MQEWQSGLNGNMFLSYHYFVNIISYFPKRDAAFLRMTSSSSSLLTNRIYLTLP
ncbi:hypothetical protein PO124_25920 [Bacillus licheniformis]|nr:hypothetical protein [Bacillus licheniformis]